MQDQKGRLLLQCNLLLVSPTVIETEMVNDITRSYSEGKYPFGFGKVSDVANVVVFLLSEQSKWITNQNYIIDCGAI